MPKEQRLKLDGKATHCMSIAYGDEKFDYRLWDSKKRKIARSRDVIFHEHETIADIDRSQKTLVPHSVSHLEVL